MMMTHFVSDQQMPRERKKIVIIVPVTYRCYVAFSYLANETCSSRLEPKPHDWYILKARQVLMPCA